MGPELPGELAAGEPRPARRGAARRPSKMSRNWFTILLHTLVIFCSSARGSYILSLSKLSNSSLCQKVGSNMTASQPLSSNFSALYVSYNISADNVTKSGTVALNASCECANYSLVANFADSALIWYTSLLQPKSVIVNQAYSANASSTQIVVQIQEKIFQLLPDEPLSQVNGTVTLNASVFCGSRTKKNSTSTPNVTGTA